jgi:hypothetical protein
VLNLCSLLSSSLTLLLEHPNTSSRHSVQCINSHGRSAQATLASAEWLAFALLQLHSIQKYVRRWALSIQPLTTPSRRQALVHPVASSGVPLVTSIASEIVLIVPSLFYFYYFPTAFSSGPRTCSQRARQSRTSSDGHKSTRTSHTCTRSRREYLVRGKNKTP